ncbi:hypothetical protein A9C11_33700 (plasmid) [Pseudomonas citronellolis]|uniref:Uncharacterized protein n=1 Tax=Pseudomonas citronellolis TaxID=53408 RepID=A0A1A9KPB1_9PSED|nr:hypothetical protein [Pseudomonas citronellolis]ANI19010.1 hypothetical protein A9C11_33700 [Pseudomonas citronellolis]
MITPCATGEGNSMATQTQVYGRSVDSVLHFRRESTGVRLTQAELEGYIEEVGTFARDLRVRDEGNTLVLSFSWMRATYSYVLDKTEYGYSQRTPLGEGTILRLL